ncbi:MAG: SPOR domain-containing protein [Campylobacterota bacterium]|nr:SPOR domain-containing protein [Campylobacterota bacterium]
MEEKNELNDIILNKSAHNGNNKKLLLAVATLALILIIVVVIMNSLKSEGTSNLPQAVLPPEPIAQTDDLRDDPLFEPVEVIEEKSDDDERLNNIAQKLKKESLQDEVNVVEKEEIVIVEPKVLARPVEVQKTQTVPKVVPKTVAKTVTKPKKAVQKGQRYVQVGSFSKYEPSATFIKKIKKQGFPYIYHKVYINAKAINKVLIGPFDNENEAREALRKIRDTIESGAFLTKI